MFIHICQYSSFAMFCPSIQIAHSGVEFIAYCGLRGPSQVPMALETSWFMLQSISNYEANCLVSICFNGGLTTKIHADMA